VKALPTDDEFQNVAASFVVVQADTTNGKGKFNKRLGVTRNRTYFIVLDEKGHEIERMFGPNPRESRSPALIAMMERAKKIKMGKPLQQALIELLRHKDHNHRTDAVEILTQQRALAEDVLQDLVPLLRDKAGTVATQTTFALANMGPSAAAAIPELQKLAGDKTRGDSERQFALMALGQIDTKGQKILPTLREALKDNQYIVIGAADAAQKLGKAAKPIVPDLEDAQQRFPKGTANGYIQRALKAIRGKK
jgi:HEAT repeat protein